MIDDTRTRPGFHHTEKPLIHLCPIQSCCKHLSSETPSHVDLAVSKAVAVKAVSCDHTRLEGSSTAPVFKHTLLQLQSVKKLFFILLKLSVTSSQFGLTQICR